jgi:hypothetical protein
VHLYLVAAGGWSRDDLIDMAIRGRQNIFKIAAFEKVD